MLKTKNTCQIVWIVSQLQSDVFRELGKIRETCCVMPGLGSVCLLCSMFLFLVFCCHITLSKEWTECTVNPSLRPVLPLPVSLSLTSGSGLLFREFHGVLYSNTVLNYSGRSSYSCYFLLSLFHCMSFSFFLCVLDLRTLAYGSKPRSQKLTGLQLKVERRMNGLCLKQISLKEFSLFIFYP